MPSLSAAQWFFWGQGFFQVRYNCKKKKLRIELALEETQGQNLFSQQFHVNFLNCLHLIFAFQLSHYLRKSKRNPTAVTKSKREYVGMYEMGGQCHYSHFGVFLFKNRIRVKTVQIKFFAIEIIISSLKKVLQKCESWQKKFLVLLTESKFSWTFFDLY